MELTVAAAWCALGKLGTQEAIDAAHAALNQGIYSESLGEVIYAEPRWSEVGPRFMRALRELGIEVPVRRTAIDRLVRDFARRIVEGELQPVQGARICWAQLSGVEERSKDVLLFIGLASEWDDLPDYRSAIEAEIMKHSRSLLERPAAGADD